MRERGIPRTSDFQIDYEVKKSEEQSLSAVLGGFFGTYIYIIVSVPISVEDSIRNINSIYTLFSM